MIHQSIKPSNVLLDNNWNAKLSDVGHGKILRRKYSTDTVRSSRADPGYVMSPKHKAASAYTDPEYLTSSKVGVEIKLVCGIGDTCFRLFIL